ncbi:MAG: hypothetical protein KatS3mg117_1188 [Geminicoccaceae bacterium]|nr:MAG: hypothetical protein KatS3mg117_1188 [Geminicoccaceae bacterium]
MAAEHARALATELDGVPVAAGCLRGEPRVEDLAHRLPKPVAVLPLLMAEGYILDLLRTRLAGIDGLVLRRPPGVHPALATLVAEAGEATARARGWTPGETALLLVGHGTPRHAASSASAEALAARLAAAGSFGRVETAFLEQPPFLAERLASLAALPVVAVGLFVDAGPHGRDDVEAAIAAAPANVAYTGPVGSLPAIRTILHDLLRG